MSRKNQRLNGYADWFYWSLLSSLSIVVVSGLLMIPGVIEFKLEHEVDWRLNADSRLWTVALHVLGGWLVLMLMGALWQSHMKAGWRKREHWRSGVASALSLLSLGGSGVGLYYLGSSQAQLAASLTHTGVGLLLCLVLGWHIWRGRARRSQKLALANHPASEKASASDANLNPSPQWATSDQSL